MVDHVVFVGVDTHADVHHAAVVDEMGRWLGDRGFATTPAGYAELWGWAGSLGAIAVAGVEGTSSYGAGLTRYLRAQAVGVVEVDRPDRKSRRMQASRILWTPAARLGRWPRDARLVFRRVTTVWWSRSAVCIWPDAPRSRPGPRR